MSAESDLARLVDTDRLTNASALAQGLDNVYRTVCDDGYAANFGLQWSTFSRTQLDDDLSAPLSRARLLETTGWTPESIRGQLVLEVGAGAGRFTRELLQMGAQVVAVDLSAAIDTNLRQNSDLGEMIGIQASVYDLPLPLGAFPRVLCLGVLQHTPNRHKTLASLWSFVSPGGQLVVDSYAIARRPSPYFLPKYLWRPLTRRLKPERLLQMVRWYVPKYLPLDTKLKSFPGGSEVAGLIPIPCFNHVDLPLSDAERLEWAILDTFDALGARYDSPTTLGALKKKIEALPHVRDYTLRRGHSAIIIKE